jgi:hypothetical protein
VCDFLTLGAIISTDRLQNMLFGGWCAGGPLATICPENFYDDESSLRCQT